MALYAASTFFEAYEPNPYYCDPSAPFFGFLGMTCAVVLANLGAAYGTSKSGVGIVSMAVQRHDLLMRSLIPVVMAGVLGIYGLITAIMLNSKINYKKGYPSFLAYAHLGAGLTVGISSLAAGVCIGIVGDAGVRANAEQPKIFVGMILILIFGEALGLYGLIIGLIVAQAKGDDLCNTYIPS
mmetsp:Transcript_78633/g.143908  ORF Transcript_78633/g.143908 Transcript_78633/m.143908 type:complete len:183 (+) Transcript_78633:79-627(+)